MGDLLVVDWAPPAGHRPRALIHFTFDCGTVSDLDGFDLPGQELEDIAFCSPQAAEQRLPDTVAPRVRTAMKARARHTSVYLTGGSATLATSSSVDEGTGRF
ncbi:hypothetical protein [Micromonospora deserti]|uniref:hypothetical protein n=1 Tax=Micromonospora deserti TaxID=2070366 RepID=UPI0013148E58|nr:hypothetical protein [Micromonospora deserti]